MNSTGRNNWPKKTSLNLYGFGALIVCALTLASLPAFAAPNILSQRSGLTVNNRYNPAYDAPNIRVGDLILAPAISGGYRFTDNVYATKTAKVSDSTYTVRPEMTLRSNFIRHQIAASFFAERGMHKDISSEDYTDYAGTLTGQLDVTGQTHIPALASYTQERVERGSPENLDGFDPTVFNTLTASTGIVHQGQRLAMKAIATVQKIMFDDNTGPLGFLDFSGDRDRREYSLYGSLGMAEEAFIAPFVYNEFTKIDYEQDQDSAGFMRDATRYEVGVGTLFNISDITRSSFNVGYITSEYDDPRFSSAGSWTYGLNVVWEPSTLASFILSGNRSTNESTLSNASSSLSSSLNLAMNYELYPNVFLRPGIGYTDTDYEGVDRQLTTLNAGMQMTYKLNQNLWFSGSYQYITQSEKGQAIGDEFDSNTYNISLKLQF